MHFSEWVICQGHRHENRIDRRATRWRTTAIRSSSWSSNWAVWPWVPEGRSKWFLLAQHQGLLEDMDTCFQAIRKNTSSCAFTFKKPGKICHDKMIFWCHLFGPNCSFLIPCHVIILRNPSADLFSLTLCAAVGRVRRALLLQCVCSCLQHYL